MSRAIRTHLPSWRLLIAAPFVAFAALSISACGGNGNGNGGIDDDDDIIILPTYGYQISAVPGVGPMTVTIPDEGGARIVSVDFGNTLNGDVNLTINFADNTATVIDYTLQALSTMSVDSDDGAPFLGAFTVNVTEDMFFLVGEPPSSGSLEIVTPGGTITVEVFSTGVQIRLDGGLPTTLTWDELESMLDDPQFLLWMRQAALAAEVLEFVLIHFLGVTDSLNWVQDELATVSQLVVPCDAFTGTPPANVLPQGETTFTWLGSGNFPRTGDDFHWEFTDCWVDDVGDSEDMLFNGTVDLNDYIEIVDGNSNLTGIGYNEVIFNLTIATTVENPPGIFTIDPNNTLTVTGGFDLAFIGFPN